MGPRLNESFHDSVDQSTSATSSNGRGGLGDELAGGDATESIFVGRRIFTPHGHWAWADGLSIDDAEDLMPLGCEKLPLQFCAILLI